MNPKIDNGVNYLYDLDFVGSGDGVGVTAAQRTWTIGCTFTGWRTALMCHGTGADGGICYTECRFEDNEVAVHYNTNRTNFFNSVAPDNQFLRNGTAILIEGEPVDQTMGLPAAGLRATAPTSTTAAASLWTSPRRSLRDRGAARNAPPGD